MLPDDYLRKMKQDLAEVGAQAESKTRYEPDPESYNEDSYNVGALPDEQETPPADDDDQSA
jgi:hypothetical protein